MAGEVESTNSIGLKRQNTVEPLGKKLWYFVIAEFTADFKRQVKPYLHFFKSTEISFTWDSEVNWRN